MKSSHTKTENCLKKTTSYIIANVYQTNRKKVPYDVHERKYVSHKENNDYIVKNAHNIMKKFPADLVTFTEESLKTKLHFL